MQRGDVLRIHRGLGLRRIGPAGGCVGMGLALAGPASALEDVAGTGWRRQSRNAPIPQHASPAITRRRQPAQDAQNAVVGCALRWLSQIRSPQI
ncbi:hypothetical protein PhaeoP18_02137 [Phaeobacter piscinae]|uniref:Uncharacterized protein n=1 Tax=Phaeobacter piscinae TaxID=1580596 RepID=A0AAN1LB26_9RHOB|nr:hypothetical protein PhaeoP13_02162 [Phaeobacter piscinae]AUR36395.1 hypothetical protein PhaeoP18_02137 [Phaeobacter piscinae]